LDKPTTAASVMALVIMAEKQAEKKGKTGEEKA